MSTIEKGFGLGTDKRGDRRDSLNTALDAMIKESNAYGNVTVLDGLFSTDLLLRI